jgi:hypothetical protein
MKISSIIIASMALFFATSAFADSNLDPKIIIGDPTCDMSDTSCIHIHGDSFTFALPTTTSGFFSGMLVFENDTNETWFKLFLTETALPFSQVSCQTNAFFNACDVVPSSDLGTTTIKFTDDLPNPGTGIPSGGVFSLDFEPNTPGGAQWPSGTSFGGTATGTVVPEPGTFSIIVTELLMFIGVGAIVSRKRFRRNLKTNFSSNTR